MYQVLYRKWRPQVFRDVVGQPHVTNTLLNELRDGRLSHAYLFTGSRGTGKTTCAKILAKAMNCEHPVNGDPCNECEICKGIDSGSILDVIEIDAASNNGVDNIRDLREEANFTPVNAKYRVYIIDEVHMLSIGAFNALLKTLEEPPEHVKFILATTEVHKLPATILSRCQRFDFRRIAPEDIAERLKFVAAEEGMTIDDEGALLIARLADGALRDALSILDQCAGRGDKIDAELVSEAAGMTGRGYLFDIAKAVNDNDSAAVLQLLDELHNSSCDMERLCTELINHYRNIMVVKTVKNPENLIVCTQHELEQTESEAQGQTLEAVLYALDILQSALERMRSGVSRRTEMEMAMLKLTMPKLATDNEALLRRISVLESALASGNFTAAPEKTEQPNNTVSHTTETKSDDTVKNDTIESSPKKPQINNADDDYDMPPLPESPYDSASLDGNTMTQNEVNKPAPKAETVSAPKQPQAPAQPQPKQSQNGSAQDIPFMQWPEVLREVASLDRPLIGILNKSTAFLRGDEYVLISSSNTTLGQFLKQGSHASAIIEAVKRVTGKQYRLGIYHRKEETVQVKKDPLDGLIQKLHDAEVDVNVE